jgi:prophage antirepressor-like protein
MSELIPFEFRGSSVRVVTIDGEPWFVVADLAAILGYRDAANAARLLRATQQGYSEVSTPGGRQQMLVTNESGLNRLILRSNRPEAEEIQEWIEDEVMPSIRKTGSYGQRELSRKEMAQYWLDAEERAEIEAARADREATFRHAIEAGDGLTPTQFHKKYFSEVAEREFFEHLFARKYLIDQRGKGARRDDGTFRDGAEHRHPTWKGKPYFYLHSAGMHGGKRRESTRVRPGHPELELKAALIRDGLAANNNDTGALFALEAS